MDIWAVSIFLAVVINAAMNICIQISVWVSAFNSFAYVLSSGIAGSHGHVMFNLLRKHQAQSRHGQ